MKKTVSFIMTVFVGGLLSITNSAVAQKKVTCPECHGSKKSVEQCSECRKGAVYCTTCNYTGKIRTRCSSCNGSGYTSRTVKKTCPDCNGQRFFRKDSPVKCSDCGGSGKVSLGRTVGGHAYNCRRCGGSGQVNNYINVACRTCGASGYSGTETIREKCNNCDNGYVVTQCSKCNGTGAYMCTRCKGYEYISVDCRRCRGEGVIYVYSE